MWAVLREWMRSAALYIAAFLSGIMREKYEDAKRENKAQAARDEIDAQRSLDADAVLERMRKREL